MPFSIMMTPHYHDVTHFSTDPNENCTEYVELKIKDILFMRIFLIFGIFIEQITIYYENHVYSAVNLHLSGSIPITPSPLGPPLGGFWYS